MTYTMVKKSPFRFPTERYLNIVKREYKDSKLNDKFLKNALKDNEYIKTKYNLKNQYA